jgi:hypothetical protein
MAAQGPALAGIPSLPSMSETNPCLTCGACCAHFRVSFYWGECASAGGSVPDLLTVPILGTHFVAMQGTDARPVRCVGLLGDVGGAVRCSLYEKRSSTCREFEAAWIHGEPNPHCDAARAAHGLPPLTPPLQPDLSPERVA